MAAGSGVQSFLTGSRRPANAGRAPPPAGRPPLLSSAPLRAARRLAAQYRRANRRGPWATPRAAARNRQIRAAAAPPMRPRSRCPTTSGTQPAGPRVPPPSAQHPACELVKDSPPSEGQGAQHWRGTVVVDGWGRGVGPSPIGPRRRTRNLQGPPRPERKRAEGSLGGPWRTLVRRSCPTDEGPAPLSSSGVQRSAGREP